MQQQLDDHEFVGYTFRGEPERRPRMWFLDRHLEKLYEIAAWNVSSGGDENHIGHWTANIPRIGYVSLRYEHLDPSGSTLWNMVWRLTDTTIPDPADAKLGFGITTFGRDDDVWRLGLWPD